MKAALAHGKTGKHALDIHLVMERVAQAVRPFTKAAMFELAEQGFNSVFEQLAACIISIRTLDEVTVPVAQRLFGAARTPEQVFRLSPGEINQLIGRCTFHEAKARNIHRIAQATVEQHGGTLPCDEATLRALPGVGPKCANLVLGIACGQSRISVDIHVHRVTNRWGYVQSRAPEQTMASLEAHLPKEYWVEINRLLVPFGKHICTGLRPHCSTCPVEDMCRQVGVKNPR